MPYLRTENLKNHTLFRGTYLYSPYMGVPPPGVYISFFFNSHTSKCIFFLFFVIYVTVSSISNTMLKLHNTRTKFKKFTHSNCDAQSSPLFSQLGLIKLLDLLTNHTALFKFQFHHNLLATAFDNFFSLILSKHIFIVFV